MERRSKLRDQILKAREEGKQEGERKGVNKGVNMAVIPIGLAAGVSLFWQYVLRPVDMPPTMSDALSPPPATAPADMDEVDSRARDPEYIRQYAEQINSGLIFPRSEETVAQDLGKMKNIFKFVIKSLNRSYANIPTENGTMITHQVYYQAIEESVIREAMGKSEAEPADIKQYWDNLPQSEQAALRTKILEARDIQKQEVLKTLAIAQAALDAFLAEHTEYQVSGQGRGR